MYELYFDHNNSVYSIVKVVVVVNGCTRFVQSVFCGWCSTGSVRVTTCLPNFSWLEGIGSDKLIDTNLLRVQIISLF
jgi:hypothetical protein